MLIESVKENRNYETNELISYLVNNSTFVPIDEDNNLYKEVKEWLKTNQPEPSFSLDELKKLKKNEIKEMFNKELLDGFVCSNGIRMDCDLTSIQSLKAGYDLALTLSQSEMKIRDFDNNIHLVLLNDVLNMITELAINYQSLLNKKWDLEKQIDICNSEDCLKLILW